MQQEKVARSGIWQCRYVQNVPAVLQLVPLEPFWRDSGLVPPSIRNSVGMPEGESMKDFLIGEKVNCEELGLGSLENGRKGKTHASRQYLLRT